MAAGRGGSPGIAASATLALRGGPGAFSGRGEGLMGPWKAAGALRWSFPPDTAPPEEGPGQPRRPEDPDAAEA